MKLGDRVRIERTHKTSGHVFAVQGVLTYYAEADEFGCGGAELKNPSVEGYEGFWALGEDRANGVVTTVRPIEEAR